METTFKHIKGIIDRLQSLYTEHLLSFDKEELPDLDRQTADRTMEMELLMKEINNFVKRAESPEGQRNDTESMLRSFNDRITAIREQNSALELKVTALKNGLQKEMARVSKGKKVIGAYRSPAARTNATPCRVLSIAN